MYVWDPQRFCAVIRKKSKESWKTGRCFRPGNVKVSRLGLWVRREDSYAIGLARPARQIFDTLSTNMLLFQVSPVRAPGL